MAEGGAEITSSDFSYGLRVLYVGFMLGITHGRLFRSIRIPASATGPLMYWIWILFSGIVVLIELCEALDTDGRTALLTRDGHTYTHMLLPPCTCRSPRTHGRTQAHTKRHAHLLSHTHIQTNTRARSLSLPQTQAAKTTQESDFTKYL